MKSRLRLLPRLRSGFFHSVGWWAAFASVFASTATCPCCGQVAAGCPTSLAGAGLVGIIGSWLMTRLRTHRGVAPSGAGNDEASEAALEAGSVARELARQALLMERCESGAPSILRSGTTTREAAR